MTNVILNKEIPDDSICSAKDIATLLSVDRLTLYRWIKHGQIPSPIRIGDPQSRTRPHLRWRVGDIRDWAREIGIIKNDQGKTEEAK